VELYPRGLFVGLDRPLICGKLVLVSFSINQNFKIKLNRVSQSNSMNNVQEAVFGGQYLKRTRTSLKRKNITFFSSRTNRNKCLVSKILKVGAASYRFELKIFQYGNFSDKIHNSYIYYAFRYRTGSFDFFMNSRF